MQSLLYAYHLIGLVDDRVRHLKGTAALVELKPVPDRLHILRQHLGEDFVLAPDQIV